MFSEGNSLSSHPHHNRVLLSPIKKPKKKKVIQEKQKNFVLDCTNKCKARLEEYNYLKDKYLNYCVVKIPKRKRIVVNAGSRADKGKQNSVIKDHANFKHFLESKRSEIMAQTNLTMDYKIKHQNYDQSLNQRPFDQIDQNRLNLQSQ